MWPSSSLRQGNLRNDFTSDRRTIAHSISVANGRGKTHLYKALDLALDKLENEKGRRKAIIVLTDGVDSDVKDIDRKALDRVKDDQIPTALRPEASETLIRILNRSDAQGVTIYPLALPTGDPARLADPTPAQIAMFTAAARAPSDRRGPLGRQHKRHQQPRRHGPPLRPGSRRPSHAYTIEYTPTNEKRDGKWRSIRIDCKKCEYVLANAARLLAK